MLFVCVQDSVLCFHVVYPLKVSSKQEEEEGMISLPISLCSDHRCPDSFNCLLRDVCLHQLYLCLWVRVPGLCGDLGTGGGGGGGGGGRSEDGAVLATEREWFQCSQSV